MGCSGHAVSLKHTRMQDPAKPSPGKLMPAQLQRRRVLGASLSFAGLLTAGSLAGTPPCACAAAAPRDSDFTLPPGKRYLVKEIAPRIHWLTDGAYSTMFVVTDSGVIACDAPPTLGLSYLAAVREVTDLPVTHLVYSHEHVDHIGASTVFPREIEIIASERTAQLLRSRRDPLRRVPTRTFEEAMTLDVGGQRLELRHRGPNHSVDNSFIFAPAQKVLMLVDVVYPGWMPYKNLGVAVDIPGFVASHAQAMEYDFELLVAGHVSRPGTREDVLVQMALLRDLEQAAQQAYDQLSFPAFLAKAAPASGRTAWELHNEYEQALVSMMERTLLPRWTGRLRGVEAYLRDNCWAMLETFVVQGRPSSAPATPAAPRS